MASATPEDTGTGTHTTEPLVDEAGRADRRAPSPVDRRGATVGTHGGLSVPRLGLGTWELSGSETVEAVEAALDIGYRHVDTAQMYGNEEAVGTALATAALPRDEVFVTTKVDNDAHEPSDLVASTEASLERLGLDHVDLLLLHWPTDWDRIGATMAALAQVHAGGLTRAIGVANFTLEQLDEVRDMAPLEVLQCECHPRFRQEGLREWCRTNGWVFTAYSPLGRGQVMDDPDLTEIADRHDTTPAAVAIAWLLSRDGVSAIPRSSRRAHLQQNWDAQFLELEADDLARIARLEQGDRVVDPDAAPW